MKNSRSLGDCGFSFAVANVVIVFCRAGWCLVGVQFPSVLPVCMSRYVFQASAVVGGASGGFQRSWAVIATSIGLGRNVG